MVQHKVKQKVSLPAGVKQKSVGMKAKKGGKGPKKGHMIQIKPKKQAAIDEAKLQKAVTKFINEKNQEEIRGVAESEHSVPSGS